MIYLLFSILCSSLIFIIFKWFEKLGVDTLEGIVYNYWIAAIFGFSFLFVSGGNPFEAETDWLWIAGIEGVLFISVFFIMATTAQKISVSASSVAAKMSMVIPIVIFMIINSDEKIGLLKITAVLLAMLAIYYTTKKNDSKWNKQLFYLPVLLFIGSGIIDFLLGYAEQTYLSTSLEQELFIPTIFLITGIIGMIILVARYVSGRLKFNPKSLWTGALLGIVNYGSLYFLIKTFESGWIVKSSVYAINNIGIICFSVVLAFVIFNERPSRINLFGLILGLIAIVIILLN